MKVLLNKLIVIDLMPEIGLEFHPEKHRFSAVVKRINEGWIDLSVRIKETKLYGISIPINDMITVSSGKFDTGNLFKINFNRHFRYDHNTKKLLKAAVKQEYK